MRKLASIVTVSDIEPIESADFIAVAKVKGWNVIIRKDDDGIKLNKKAVMFEIDSYLPHEEPYLFLKNSSYKKHANGSEGFRLKTVKFRGQISQGLLMSLETFEDAIPDIHDLPVGTDLTGRLGVTEYEPFIPSCLKGKVIADFPAYMRRTEQERIQNLMDYFTRYKDMTWEATEKVDGTSVTYFLKDGTFGTCSRNWLLGETRGNVHWEIAKRTGVENVLRSMGKNIAVQGEIAGVGIRGEGAVNPLRLKNRRFFVFDIWDIDALRYLTPSERLKVYDVLESKGRHIEHVPVIDERTRVFTEFDNVDDLLLHAEGKSVINPERDREGIVYKSTELVGGDTISFKAKSNSYLLAQSRRRRR